MLTNALGIDEPFILVNSTIAKGGFALEGSFGFEDDPIVIDISPDLGTRYTFEAITLESSFGISMPGSDEQAEGSTKSSSSASSGSKKGSAFNVPAVLGVKTHMRIRPTQYDPDLKIVNHFKYKLKTEEISAAGFMNGHQGKPIWDGPII